MLTDLIFKAVDTVLEKLFPDPQKRAEAELELIKLKQAGQFREIEAELQVQLAQIKVNEVEAANPNLFVSGWRPAVGWVCVAGLAYAFLARPLLTFSSGQVAPAIEIGELLMLLGAMMGIGTLRSLDKWKGVTK